MEMDHIVLILLYIYIFIDDNDDDNDNNDNKFGVIIWNDTYCYYY